jgi:hypothetical protein
MLTATCRVRWDLRGIAVVISVNQATHAVHAVRKTRSLLCFDIKSLMRPGAVLSCENSTGRLGYARVKRLGFTALRTGQLFCDFCKNMNGTVSIYNLALLMITTDGP